ncbi:MAG: RNA methyltransferase [Rhodospirillales bacterium]
MTDRPPSKAWASAAPTGAPAVVLVAPQLAENIGAVARAMLNFGLTDLRLVRPRPQWPSEAAINTSAGADSVLAAARLYDTTAAAVADLTHVFATTARVRDMEKPAMDPRAAAGRLRTAAAAGEGCGLLFGPERSGLHNDDLTFADALVIVPTNPAFSSLNLAQAVLLCAWEWQMAGGAGVPDAIARKDSRPATREEIQGFFDHLEGELDRSGFLRVPQKRPRMVRNIRNIFNRAALTDQEVRTLRGIVAFLTRGRGEGVDEV